MASLKEVVKKQQPIARALYTFKGQTEQELSFSPGEAILLLKRVDDNWLEGELDGQIGIFPKNRVKVEVGSPSLSHESALARSGRPYGVVLNDFNGTCPGDLSIVQGQIIELLGQVGNSGWTKGKVNDTIGIFPSSFVEIIQPLAKPIPKPRNKPVPKPRTSTTQLNNGTAHSNNSTAHSTNSTAHSNNSTAHSNNDNGSAQVVVHNDSAHSTRNDTTHSTNDDTAHSLNDSLPHFNNVTSFERHLSNLHTKYEIEEKMRQSAESLSKVCTNDEKREKLLTTMSGHEEKSRKISEEIDLLESQRDLILLQLTSQQEPLIPPSPINDTTTNSVDDDNDSKQKGKVTQELIETEHSYYNELSSFCTKVLPAFKQWNEVICVDLFANIEEVSLVSGKLYTQLIKEVGEVGTVFKNSANEIKEVYGTYCRNHDNASQVLEKLYEDKDNVTTIKSLMDLGRPEVTSWDLHTLLIKPVQRVLKYPLLLSKLLELTPRDDDNYKQLSTAVKLSSQVAQDINEIKRRKDLLERYTGAGRDDRRLNFGTMRKKMRRFRQTLTQKTGLRSATMDSNYATEETQVFALESLLRSLQTDINSWIDEGEQLISSSDTLLDIMTDYISNSSIITTYKDNWILTKEKWKQQVREMKEEIIQPLSTLISFFNDPILLMNKRSDKLLDYDSLQYDLEKCTEMDKIQQLKEDVTLAKRTYEALNTQLLEDLPQFRDKVTQGLCTLLIRYLKLQISYHHQFITNIASSSSAEGILQNHLSSLQDVFNSYCSLSIVPSSLSLSFGIVLTTSYNKTLVSSRSFEEPSFSSRPPLIKRTSRSQSVMATPTGRPYIPSQSPIYEEIPDNIVQDIIRPISPPQHNDTPTFKTTPPAHDYDTPPDEDSDHEYLIPPDATTPTLSLSPLSMDSPIKAHSSGMQFKVEYDFNGENEYELTLEEGQIVTLITSHDQNGSDEWWYVQDNESQETGYVPADFLKLIQ